MPRKLILCRCEDVTAEDVAHAVAAGFQTIEEIKRYTGFGTGPCQGKECLVPVSLAVLRAGVTSTVRPFTARSPLSPIELKYFAATPDRDDD